MAYQAKSGHRARKLAKRARASSQNCLKCELLEQRIVLSATPVVIDLLALYTSAASGKINDLAGTTGDGRIKMLIQESVDSTNQAMINSQISITIRLVGIQSINYTDSDNLYTDRTWMETSSSVAAARTAADADLVTMVTYGADIGGGNASLITSLTDPNNHNLAFSAIAYNSIGAGNLTMAHEIGHNLGAGHERGNVSDPAVGPFDYSYGYRFPVSNSTVTATYNDIMSYSYNQDIPLFSYANPNVLEHGVPTGVSVGQANEADLASTFVQTAPIVAAYGNNSLVTHIADTTAPTADLFEIDRSGSSLTFTIRYKDDSGIDLSTIGNGDVYISGPGGFSLPATFVSIDNPTVAGAYKFATYHVTLPASNPATSSLTFSLQSNAIKDINGNSAAAGAIANHTAYYAGSPYDFGAGYAAYSWAQPLSATLMPSAVFNEYGSLSPDDTAHFYSFTLTQSAVVETTLTGLTDNADIQIFADSNHNDLNDDTALEDTGFNAGTDDEGIHVSLGPGTYYVLVDINDVTTSSAYTMTLRAITNDTTSPTGMLDAHDLTTAGAPYIEFGVTYTDDNFLDGLSVLQNAGVDIHVQTDIGGDFTLTYYPNAAQDESYADAQTKTIYYDIYAFNSNTGWTSNDNGTYTVSIHSSASMPQDVSGNAVALGMLGSYKINIGKPDTTAPIAILAAAPPVTSMSTWTFNVIYQDSGGLNTGSLDGNDIKVTGPNSFSQMATFVSVSPLTSIGGTEIATYQVNAPGGYWDSTDDGAYTVALQANQVKDSANNFASAQSFSAVTASDPALTSLGVSGVEFNGSSSADTMRIDSDSSFVYFNLNDSTLYFVPKSSVPRFTINSLAGDDTIDYQSGTLTGSVIGGTGNNTLNVSGGALTLDADGGASSSVLTISVASPGSLIFNTTQHLTSLSLTGSATATMAAGGGKVVDTTTLSIGSSATLDVNDDGLIYDYTGSTPITTIRGLIQTAYNTGHWNGVGLNSTAARNDATKSHDLAYADASALNVSSFMGQHVDTTSILVGYTLSGNTNLDQIVNVTDLFAVSKNWLQTGKTYNQGDLNYDGKVDLTDLQLLSANWNKTTGTLLFGPILAPIAVSLPISAPPAPITVAVLSNAPPQRTTVRLVTTLA